MSRSLPGVQVDDTMAGYRDDSRHRQQIDASSIVDIVLTHLSDRRAGVMRDRQPLVVDLGCGVGDLITRLAAVVDDQVTFLGVDASHQRIEQCRRDFGASPRYRFEVTDLLDDLPFRSADAITMTAVLHWLYPREEQVIGAVARTLEPEGLLVLTTYHPRPEVGRLGGTDAVVAEALEFIDAPVAGIDAVRIADFFEAAGVQPISFRTRTRDDIGAILRGSFRSVRREVGTARTSPASGDEFADYFLSTFGGYFEPLFPSGTAMRAAISAAAAQRLDRLGHVTTMDVSTWTCTDPIHFGSAGGPL